jgi:amino acid adenylation domain-containing protein
MVCLLCCNKELAASVSLLSSRVGTLSNSSDLRGLVSCSSQSGGLHRARAVPQGRAGPTSDLFVPGGSAGFASDGESHVVESIKRRAIEKPHAPAIIDGPIVLSYGELEERSNEIAKRLGAMGVTRDVVVGVFAERSIALAISALGIMRAGGAYLPLDPGYPKERLTFQLLDAHADIVLAGEGAGASEVSDMAKHVLECTRDGRFAGHATGEPISTRWQGQDLAYVIYTSGSTGRPKGVEITHANLSNMIGWYVRTLGVHEADRISHVAAVGFDATVWELWPALAGGASIFIADNSTVKEPRQLQDWLVREGITISFIPTPMAEKLMAFKWPTGTRLRIMMTGGDTLHSYPPSDLLFKVINNYGPTECTICATSTVLPTGNHFNHLPPIGWPIANTQIYIVDDELRQVPSGVEGEILIGGRGVGRGYRNRPDLTAEKFIPNVFEPSLSTYLYRTGDRGCYLADGQIAFKGRIDSQIKIRGVRMEPGEIEAALNEHPAVRESAVVAHEFGPGDKRLVAYIVPNSQFAPTPHDLRSSLAKRLPAQMIPAIFVSLDRLPLNASGKIDRHALPSPNKANTLAREAGAPPRDELEKQLEEIWERVFQMEDIGVQEDFFELGGDSLLAVQLMAHVDEALKFTAPLSSLLEVRTIEDMAKKIRGHDAGSHWSPMVAVQPRGSKPALFCVHSHTGDVLYCEYISRGAGPDQPVYGIQSQGVAGKPPHQTIEEMARLYIEELRKVQPQGPYHLFGFCFGGMVAFEMAKQLGERGEAVGFLGIYNSPAPGTLKGWPLGQFTYMKRRTQDEWRRLMAAEPGETMALILRNIRNFRLLVQRTVAIEGSKIASKLHANGRGTGSLNLEAINISAAKRFHPAYVFPGRITLFLSTEVAKVYPIAPADGWKRFASKGLEVIEVPLDEKGWRGTPFVETVGGRIGDLLRAAELEA